MQAGSHIITAASTRIIVGAKKKVLLRAMEVACRTHLDHEIDWMAPAALLDQFGSAGWSLISGLMSGQNSAAHLLASNPFVSLETQ